MAWYHFKSKTATVTVPKRRRKPRQVKASANLANTWYGLNRQYLNSPNNELRRHIVKTRELARLLCSIDPYAAKYLELLSVQVIGEGMQINPRVVLPSGELDASTNDAIAKAWSEWCDVAGYDGRQNMSDLEQLAVRTLGRDGECMFRVVRGKSVNRFGFALQPLDVALLDDTYNAKLSDTAYIYMGVEFRGNTVVAYHMYNRHVDDLVNVNGANRYRERVPADEIIHVFDDDYGQLVRGASWLTPAMKTIARLHEYLDSHLLAMQVAANAPLVMHTKEDDATDYLDVGVSGAEDTSMFDTPTLDLSYSQIIELGANKELKSLDLKYPQTGMETAVKTYLQQIAAGLSVSYASLVSDSTSESYSTVRHQSILERDHWTQVQTFIKRHLHTRIYRAWVEAALLSGALALSAEPEELYAVEFRPRGYVQQDPRKDMAAYLDGIKEGLYSRAEIVAKNGGDWYENVKQLAAEKAFAAEQGITLGENVGTIVVPEATPQTEPTTDTPDVMTEAPPTTDVASTGLNGAQVTALLSVILQVTTGAIPKDSAAAVISAAFPMLTTAVINGMLSGLSVSPPVNTNEETPLPNV